MTYETWRITYQSSEQAARAAYAEVERLQEIAARYQYLKDNCIQDVPATSEGPAYKRLIFTGPIYHDWRFALDHIGLDAAIDKVRKQI